MTENYPIIEIKKNVVIQKAELLLDYYKMIKSNWIVPFLELASENPKSFNHETISKYFGLPENLSSRIERKLMEINYIYDGSLTKSGINAIKEPKVPSPHSGIAEIDYIDDKIFEEIHPFVRFKISKISAEDLRKRTVSVDKENTMKEANLPECFTNPDILNKELIMHDNNSIPKAVTILKIQDKCFKRGNIIRATINLKIRPKIKPDFVLMGKEFTNRHLELKVDYHKTLEEILERIKKKGRITEYSINNDGIVLFFHFNQLKENEILSFKKDLREEQLYMTRFGSDNKILIKNCQIGPANQEDADRWSKALLKHNIGTYMTTKEYDEIQEEIKEKFKKFNYKIVLPEISEFIAELSKEKENISDREKFWYLQAPIDLTGNN